jgi:hypothetical protein
MSLEAELAVEWMKASGVQTRERLRGLVEHFCDTNGTHDPGTREAIFAEAMRACGWTGA